MTCRHNFTLKNWADDVWLNMENQNTPNNVRICNKTKDGTNYIVSVEWIVGKNGNKIYHEFKIPNMDKYYDIAILKITDFPEGIEFYPVDLLNDMSIIKISDKVSIAGYPKGENVQGTPIFQTGHISSEPSLGIDGMPNVYLDFWGVLSGFSGGPVYLNSSEKMNFCIGMFSGGNEKIKHSSFIKSNLIAELLDSIE